MRNNGNGWIRSYWIGAAKVAPRQAGWYAVRPECCDITVRAFLAPNLLDVYVEGDDLKRDIYDYEWWYPLDHEHQRLPEFK